MCVIPFSKKKSQFLGACEVCSRDKWDIRWHSNTRPHCSNLLSASGVTWQKQLSAWSPDVKSEKHLNCSSFSVFSLIFCNTYMTMLMSGRPLCGHLGYKTLCHHCCLTITRLQSLADTIHITIQVSFPKMKYPTSLHVHMYAHPQNIYFTMQFYSFIYIQISHKVKVKPFFRFKSLIPDFSGAALCD